MLGRSIAVAPSARLVEHVAPSRSQWALAAAGVVYLVASLSVGLWYLSLLSPSLSNDLWWAGFTATGGEALLIDLVNAELALVATSALNIYAADATMYKLYNASTAATSVLPTYARRAILSELTSIEYAVPQLRTVSGSWSMRINVQHCWVDFNKSFEVAHTTTRQERCERSFATNGAVYMEAILRNVVWADFIAIWGGDDAPFTVAVQRALEETATGQAFLSQVSQARNTTPISDELLYWRQYKLDRFQLQWQNRWQVGITESILLKNAIGMQQLVTTKNLPRLTGPWTSLRLFWIPLNDLWNLHDMNRSLVRGSSRDFRANVSAALPAMDLEVYIGETSVVGQFINQAALFRSTVGPFESIDLVYFAVPPGIVQAFLALRRRLAGNDLLTALPRSSVGLTPLGWRSFAFYGGDPTCTALPRTTYVQQSFDFFYDCSKPKPLTLVFDPLVVVLARAATSSPIIADICAVASPTAACVAAITAADQLLQSLASPLVWNASVADEVGLEIRLMQYATAANGSWVVLKQALLEPSFALFGWIFLFDWVLGNREVVSFQGDNGNLTLISNVYTPQLYTTGTQPLQSATQILYYLVVATSVILVSVGGIVLVYAVKTRFQFNGLNLFFFNRIVGAVWLGRPLAFLRGASAIVLLSSANASLLTSSAGASRFIATPRSWIEAVIVTGEATWLTYVANDILVLLTRDCTKEYSSMASLLSWLILLALDVAHPIVISGDLQRQCTGVELDYGLACTSGVVSTGSSTRVATILLVQGGAFSVASVAGSLKRRPRSAKAKNAEASLLVNGITQAFVRTAQGTTDARYVLDHVACVLAGLLPIAYKGISYTFDVKLWLLLKDTLSTTQRTKVLRRPALARRAAPSGPLFVAPHANDVHSDGHRQARAQTLLYKLVGLGYIVSSILGSVSYLNVSKVNLANDVFWATFNTTGAHAFLANWLNEQLVIGNTTMLDLPLDRPSINAMASFASSTALVASPQNYGAYLQHTLLSSIEATIEGLRRSNGCDAPWIFSPYCYLDLKRSWTMANSAKRQARCDASMTTNGAVYLETVLRNVDFGSFQNCWGTGFEIGIGAELKLSSEGRAWLDMVSGTAPQLSASDEAVYWRSFGLTTYQTQWQNYKKLGVRNSYSIINAFGIEYPLTLASQPGIFRRGSQTTFKMYWSLANDLSAVASNSSGIGGLSLLRSSATYAFANSSLSDVYVINGTLPSPLPQSLQLTTSYLGPFGSIDMVYVAPPLELQQLTSLLLELTRAPLPSSLAAQAAYYNITPLDATYPVPAAFLIPGLLTFGGSPLCADFSSPQSLQAGLRQIVSYGGICMSTSGVITRITPSRQQYVFGAVLARLPRQDDYRSVCRHEPTFASQCSVYLPTTLWYIDHFMELPPSIAQEAVRMHTRVHAMNISFLHFEKTSARSPLTLQRINLLAPTETDFNFFAWLFLYDWVLGVREVVSFQGDDGVLTLLTDSQSPLSQATQAWEVPSNIAQYLHSGVVYVTGVMMAIASLALMYILVIRGQFEGWNMLELGRVGGIVWVGRPFLLLRSVTAMVVLSTATLQLQTSGSLSHFATVHDRWYKTLLAANEVTWLITIVNDVLLVVTGEFAYYYVALNSYLVWAVVALLTFLSPVTPTASFALTCRLTHVDLDAECTAGAIDIGSLHRMLLLVATVLLSHIACYGVVKLCFRASSAALAHSHFLSSGAKYQYTQAPWMHNNVYYVDRASAALDGLLTLRWGSHLMVLDIKIWRAFAIPMQATIDMPDALSAALPLLD